MACKYHRTTEKRTNNDISKRSIGGSLTEYEIMSKPQNSTIQKLIST